MRLNKAQITIEYLLLIGLAFLVMVVVFSAKDSKLREGVNDTVAGSKDMIINMIDEEIPD